MIEPSLSPSPADGLAELVAKEQTLIRRLRVLNANLSQADGSTIQELEKLLELFPEGWARRRALCALLREGIPADNQLSCRLIDGLDSPVSRKWCRNILEQRTLRRG